MALLYAYYGFARKESGVSLLLILCWTKRENGIITDSL